MSHALLKDTQAKMQKSLENLQHELGTIRTGRASVGLLDVVDVEASGSKMKINQVGTVTAPEPRLLLITPWDKSLISTIEKAVRSSQLELSPSNDGQVIRVPIPQLTEERRRDLVKLIGKLGEETRVAVRTIRRHTVDEIKKEQKDGKIPEDDAHKLTNEVQKATDDFIEKIEHILKSKEEEIMEV